MEVCFGVSHGSDVEALALLDDWLEAGVLFS